MNTANECTDTHERQKPEPWIILPGHTYGGEVGTFSVDFIISNPATDQSRALNGMVDTGAAYSVVPGAILAEMGVEAGYTEPFVLADGSEVELAVGWVAMELDGKRRPVHVVFGPDDETILVGAMSLEAFALAADARNGRLIPGRLTLLATSGPSAN